MSPLGDAAGLSGARRKRSWSRAVFSNLQRKGLEKRFVLQKYITKPDRRQLAATLGLTDAQVKVWFQNRRMKWRHSKEYREEIGKSGAGGSTSPSLVDDEDDASPSGLSHRHLHKAEMDESANAKREKSNGSTSSQFESRNGVVPVQNDGGASAAAVAPGQEMATSYSDSVNSSCPNQNDDDHATRGNTAVHKMASTPSDSDADYQDENADPDGKMRSSSSCLIIMADGEHRRLHSASSTP